MHRNLLIRAKYLMPCNHDLILFAPTTFARPQVLGFEDFTPGQQCVRLRDQQRFTHNKREDHAKVALRLQPAATTCS